MQNLSRITFRHDYYLGLIGVQASISKGPDSSIPVDILAVMVTVVCRTSDSEFPDSGFPEQRARAVSRRTLKWRSQTVMPRQHRIKEGPSDAGNEALFLSDSVSSLLFLCSFSVDSESTTPSLINVDE